MSYPRASRLTNRFSLTAGGPSPSTLAASRTTKIVIVLSAFMVVRCIGFHSDSFSSPPAAMAKSCASVSKSTLVPDASDVNCAA